MDSLDVPWGIHPPQGIGTPPEWALDNVSLWIPVTMHTKVQFDGLG